MAAGVALSAGAYSRLPAILPAQYGPEQKQAAAEFEAARKILVSGPFVSLMYSPQVMTQAQALGGPLRCEPAMGTALSELEIPLTARRWTQDYEWYLHQPIAVKAGIRPAIAEAIADDRRPADMSDDEEIVYDFSVELHRNKRISDAIFQRAGRRFGRQDVVDLTGNQRVLHASRDAPEHGHRRAAEGRQAVGALSKVVSCALHGVSPMADRGRSLPGSL